MKVFVFVQLNWSVHRVILGIERQLPDFQFRYLESNVPYPLETFKELYNWCDVMLTNLEASRILTKCFSSFMDFKKVLYISHGAIENQVVTSYDPISKYGMTTEYLKPFFPCNITPYFTPNGVDPTLFKYTERDGKLKTLGWCGCPDIKSKRVEWANDISLRSNLELKIGYKISFYDIIEWYQTIDLLVVTAGPELYSETGPLPPFEAIVSGVPVIGTYVGNFSKIPGPKFFTVEQAVSIIEHLKENPQIVKQLAKDQYDYVMNNYTFEKIAPLWRRALEFS